MLYSTGIKKTVTLGWLFYAYDIVEKALFKLYADNGIIKTKWNFACSFFFQTKTLSKYVNIYIIIQYWEDTTLTYMYMFDVSYHFKSDIVFYYDFKTNI